MTKIKDQVKAVVGGVTAGLTALATALADQQVTQLEWVGVALAAVAAYGAVYRTGQPASLPHLTSAELLEMAERRAERERR